MVVFHHPGGKTARMDRYSWYNWRGPEARSVTSRLNGETVLKKLSDDDLKLLLRKSFPIAWQYSPLNRAP